MIEICTSWNGSSVLVSRYEHDRSESATVMSDTRGRDYHVPSFTRLTPFYYNNEIIRGRGRSRVRHETPAPL